MEIQHDLWDLEQEGFDYLFGRLASWPNLTSLDLRNCNSSSNVDGLAKLTNLTTLHLSVCNSLENMGWLAKLTKLTKLDLRHCESLENVDGLAKLTNLTELDLEECKSLPARYQWYWSGDRLQAFLKSLRESQNAT